MAAGSAGGRGSAKSAQFAWDWEVKFFLDLLLMTWIILPRTQNNCDFYV